MRIRCLRVLTIAIGLIGILTWQPANAYTILAPNSIVAGQSIADWTAAWWTWVLQAPVVTNPLLDTTGHFANVNNNGPVFFIAGSQGGAVTRSFSVPAGKPVLFPLINTFDVESVPSPDNPKVSLSEREAVANSYIS